MIENLTKDSEDKINNLEIVIHIKNNERMLELNKIIYNTYEKNMNNYYTSLSINNLLLYYSNNKDINDKMKNILGNKYDGIINIRKEKFNEDVQIKLDELNKIKEKDKEIEELNKKIKELSDKNEKYNQQIKDLNTQLNDIIKDNEINKNKLDEEKRKNNEKFEKIKKENERLNKEYNEIKEKLNIAQQKNVTIFYNYF